MNVIHFCDWVAYFGSREHGCDCMTLFSLQVSPSHTHRENKGKQSFQFDKWVESPRADVQPLQPAQKAGALHSCFMYNIFINTCPLNTFVLQKLLKIFCQKSPWNPQSRLNFTRYGDRCSAAIMAKLSEVTVLQATAVQKFGFKNATSSIIYTSSICVESVSMHSPHMQREICTGKPHRVRLRQQSRLQMGWNVAQLPFSPGYDTPWLPQA